MTSVRGARLVNATAIARRDVPVVGFAAFADSIVEATGRGARVAALFGHRDDSTGGSRDSVRLFVVLAHAATAELELLATDVAAGASFPSMTPLCAQVHLFEREVHEQFGLVPTGHPRLQPVRARPQDDFFAMSGAELHEVAVGPVHAGVIEPGHFRFQCHGESVFHLEIALGYQHRGVERALVGGPDARTLHYMETLAGDTSVGHAKAYAQAVEALADARVPARAEAIRGVALELERLANHTGDLGALANDVAFLPTASFCGRLRGDWLNLTAQLCGSRFGRGAVRPFGVGFDLEPARASEMLAKVEAAFADVKASVELLWDAPSVLARFDEIGTLATDVADELGLVGPAARASGLERDVRADFPAGIWRMKHVPVSTSGRGDVFARAYVRWLEIQRSTAFLREQLASLPGGAIRGEPAPLAPDRVAVSLVEGWRGEIAHVAITDERGRFARYKVVDPSFHNWAGLEMALRGQQVSDFPLCNKSFNLSYCGHDL
jgi:Ni,Fe-hydrogenase III large subunit